VGERELRLRRVARLDVPHESEQLRIVAKRARDRPQAAHMLGVSPPRVVPPAVGM